MRVYTISRKFVNIICYYNFLLLYVSFIICLRHDHMLNGNYSSCVISNPYLLHCARLIDQSYLKQLSINWFLDDRGWVQ